MKLYQCKIIIKNSKPPIWWRCLIPADISFSALSIILDEITGTDCKGDFSFDMLRVARIWEPTKEKPLKADYYHAAYHAAYTSLQAVFDLGKTVNYHCGDQTYRIEIENAEEGFTYPILLLLKVPRHVDGVELSMRLNRSISISGDNGNAPLTRHEMESAVKEGTVNIGLVQTNLKDEETLKPSARIILQEIADSLMKKDHLITEPANGLFSMTALLNSYSRADLRETARNLQIPVSSGDTKDKIASLLSDHLLKPETIRRYFSILNDRETAAFERVLKEKKPVRISPEDEDDFDTLRDIGLQPYVMIYDKEHCDPIYKRMQRWCNAPQIFWSTPKFEDYR